MSTGPGYRSHNTSSDTGPTVDILASTDQSEQLCCYRLSTDIGHLHFLHHTRLTHTILFQETLHSLDFSGPDTSTLPQITTLLTLPSSPLHNISYTATPPSPLHAPTLHTHHIPKSPSPSHSPQNSFPARALLSITSRALSAPAYIFVCQRRLSHRGSISPGVVPRKLCRSAKEKDFFPLSCVIFLLLS